MDTGAFEWVHTLDEEQKIKFLGGKTKAALFDAGLLNREDYFKPLKDIDLSDIIIPDRAAISHSIIGEYKQPSNEFPNGRLIGGGHGQRAIDELQGRKIPYNIAGTSNNGVRFGNVPGHGDKLKRTGMQQTWFPQNWTEHDIMAAGIKVANKGIELDLSTKEAFHKDVNVRVKIFDGRIVTICPSYDQP